ncbi:MAG: hypothetical protein ACXVC1_03080, partial [Tumebacillaceae bacterium]
MKNERIITHFQSYTTANDCVKDLTPLFGGRISIASVKRAEQTVNDDQMMATGGGAIVDDLSEIGGIALGTVADLIPGMGPILSGGPVVGAIVGDVFGDYMVARGHLNAERNAAGELAPDGGTVYVAVETTSEQEATEAEGIMRQHGGEPHRSMSGSRLDAEVGEAGEMRNLGWSGTGMLTTSIAMETLGKHSISGTDHAPDPAFYSTAWGSHADAVAYSNATMANEAF